MSFLNPLLLLGALGVVSPILIHLLAKRQIKRVAWAAMKFLKVTVSRNQRRMNLEDILLLVMRCAVVGLVALALARPALKSSSFSLSGSSETAFILVDDSGSMTASDGTEVRFEKARKAAGQVLDSLPSGSSVAVWMVSDFVRDAIPVPTHDFALARKVLRDAKVTSQAGDWPHAIRQVIDVASRLPVAQKQLYIVADAQATAWKGAGAVRALLEPVKKEIVSRFVLVGDGEERNLAATGLRFAGALATVNQPLRFEAAVSNFGAENAANVAVSLAVDDESPSDEQTLETVAGNGAATVSLYATFREPGFHTVTVRLPGDRCAFDDTRTFALNVIDEVHVLLVDGQSGSEPRESEVFYLRNALTPVPPEMRAQFFIKTKTVSGAELEGVSLKDFNAVVLANVVDVSAPVLSTLDAYVRNGGGLIVFPGERISTPFYNDRMHTELGLLPAAFASTRGEVAAGDVTQKFFHLQSKDYAHRITEPWRDPKAGSLGTPQFYKAFTLLPPRASDVPTHGGAMTTVLNFAEGSPAVLEKTHGLGRVVQFASTASARWNDLPVRPVFLPLMHRTLGHILASTEERLNARAGTPFSFALKHGTAAGGGVVTTPAGTTTHGTLVEKDGAAFFSAPDTTLAGRYSVQFPDDSEKPLRFAVFPDPSESDLRNLSSADLKTLESVAQISHWSPDADFRKALQTARTGTELWLYLAVAVLVLAIAELILGNRWSRSK